MRPGRPRIEGDWLLVPAPQEHRPYRLFCFPHAGGDATAFSPMAHALAPYAEVWALRMPARGGRHREPMPVTFDLLVDTVAEQLRPYLHGRFGFYGQSLGALLAYETARALPARLRPEVVVAASASSPATWDGGGPAAVEAEDLLRDAGMGDVVRADPELRERALATVRADLTVGRTYRHRPGPPIACALHAVAGSGDPMLGREELAGWAGLTSGAFGLSVVPGPHLLASVDRRGPVELLTSIIGRRPGADTRDDQWSTSRSI
jgi:surfactin synthase thioesterase subunit